jgi:hypothetical protein
VTITTPPRSISLAGDRSRRDNTLPFVKAPVWSAVYACSCSDTVSFGRELQVFESTHDISISAKVPPSSRVQYVLGWRRNGLTYFADLG